MLSQFKKIIPSTTKISTSSSSTEIAMAMHSQRHIEAKASWRELEENVFVHIGQNESSTQIIFCYADREKPYALCEETNADVVGIGNNKFALVELDKVSIFKLNTRKKISEFPLAFDKTMIRISYVLFSPDCLGFYIPGSDTDQFLLLNVLNGNLDTFSIHHTKKYPIKDRLQAQFIIIPHSNHFMLDNVVFEINKTKKTCFPVTSFDFTPISISPNGQYYISSSPNILYQADAHFNLTLVRHLPFADEKRFCWSNNELIFIHTGRCWKFDPLKRDFSVIDFVGPTSQVISRKTGGFYRIASNSDTITTFESVGHAAISDEGSSYQKNLIDKLLKHSTLEINNVRLVIDYLNQPTGHLFFPLKQVANKEMMLGDSAVNVSRPPLMSFLKNFPTEKDHLKTRFIQYLCDAFPRIAELSRQEVACLFEKIFAEPIFASLKQNKDIQDLMEQLLMYSDDCQRNKSCRLDRTGVRGPG